MRVSVITIFPELFSSFVKTSLVGRAVAAGELDIEVVDLRDYTTDAHRVVDDEPYGGGAGMVMKAEPWIRAVRAVTGERDCHRVLLSPRGRPLNDARVRRLARQPELVLLCGRYEDLDDRVRTTVVDEELSLGDFVLSGGEVAAMAVIEAVSRQVPGVVGDPSSVENDSFRDGILDHPHYTRPREVEGLGVPAVLLSGDHVAIARWRRKEALRNTLRSRPDLLESAVLSEEDRTLLAEVRGEDGAE
ncbi:MAG: tRNA (guanosine(37)-N1)-methyltransferase TrmD [Thermoanaerobaculia bacterium]